MQDTATKAGRYVPALDPGTSGPKAAVISLEWCIIKRIL